MKFSLLCLSLISAITLHAQDSTKVLRPALDAYDQRAWDHALQLVNAVILDHPGMEAAFKLRGDIHQRKLHYEEAALDYDRAEDLSRTDPRLYVSPQRPAHRHRQ
jgi:hypothetical protein